MRFKAELVAYRKQLIAAGVPTTSLAVRVIDRWQEHGAVETMWKTLTAKLPADALPTPAVFIGFVLQRRLLCEGVAERSREAADIKRRSNIRIARYLRDKTRGPAILLLAALDNFEKDEAAFGCEKANAPRKKFMKGWSDKFRELCGNPLDDAVRVLTEIAFGGTIPIGAVRGTSRATTRAARRDRDTRPPK